MKDPGIYRRSHLHASGFDDKTIDRMIAAGDLTRLRSGWLAAKNHDLTAAAAVSDGGVLTCVDALRFHELWVPVGRRKLHLRRSRSLSGKHPACRPMKSGTIRQRLTVATKPVDSVPSALLCATGCLNREEWIAVCDSYMNSHGLGVEDLRAELGSVGPTVTDWLYLTDPRSQSGTESISRVRLRSEGFDVVVQPQIKGVGRADLRIGLLIIECDSMQYHATKEAYERDHKRDRKALVNGWLTMRLTYDDILFGWEEVLADIRNITNRDRHRPRTPRKRELVEKSVRYSASEGKNSPRRADNQQKILASTPIRSPRGSPGLGRHTFRACFDRCQ
ncbi:endonuclease domain-containing protein [Gordonia sp. (in: high G+C Gram-positive bacteria)]|uniref:endonuclease domain-containing protein n=1 Tax=Gordonia sp. (in: high G+C Gram-positive bacteria) TaxID=84139 RepID=UPI003C73CEFF